MSLLKKMVHIYKCKFLKTNNKWKAIGDSHQPNKEKRDISQSKSKAIEDALIHARKGMCVYVYLRVHTHTPSRKAEHPSHGNC